MTTRTFFLSGFPTADAVSLTLEISTALSTWTAPTGGWGVPDSGGEEPGPGGIIAIVTEEPSSLVAPASIWFSADLSDATFDTPAPAASPGVYDPQYHDLEYFWDYGTGESDLYAAPVNVLTTWKKANIAYGPMVAKMFTEPGTYTVSLLVVEPTSGKTATATRTITILDPDAVFPGANTHVVAHDDDFLGAPAGATQHASLSAMLAAVAAIGAPQRMLLKRGGTYDLSASYNFSGWTHAPYLGDWGTGAKPILTRSALGAVGSVNSFFRSVRSDTADRRDMRFANLRFVANWMAATAENWNNRVPFWLIDNGFIMMSGLEADGCEGFLAQQTQDAGSLDPARASRLHLHDAHITNFKNAPIYHGPWQNSKVAITGSSIAQHVDGLGYWPNTGEPGSTDGDGPIRLNGSDFYMDGSEVFCNYGQNGMGAQPCLRLHDRPINMNKGSSVVDGYRANVQRSSIEGGTANITMAAGSVDSLRTPGTHTLFDKVVLIATMDCRPFVRNFCGGVTFRNMLCVVPGKPRRSLGMHNGFIWNLIAPLGGDPDYTAADWPIRTYSSTFVMERTSAQNNGFALPSVQVNALGKSDQTPGTGTGFSDVAESNNIVHAPNYTPAVTTWAPLDAATALFVPRFRGARTPPTGETGSGTLDATYAINGAALAAYPPATGSPAIAGLSSGQIAVTALDGTVRAGCAHPTAVQGTGTIGAWEP